MRGPFERRCAETPMGGATCFCKVEGSISESGHESMWCAIGHSLKQWYIVDAEGEIMARARLNSAPEIINEEMLLALKNDPLYRALVCKQPPDHPCKRGHIDWLLTPDEVYRCRPCKNAYAEVHKNKARDRYRATEAYKTNQLARQARKKAKEKNVRNKA